MKMCQAFAKNGHEVVLLAPDWKHECELGVEDIYKFYGVSRCFEIRKLPIVYVKGKNFIYSIVILYALRFVKKEQTDLNLLIVSYESIIFRTDLQLSRIVAFCDLYGKNGDWEGNFKNSIVHDVFGNRMKNDPSMRTRLIYDDRWQYRLSANLALPVLYPVWRLNLNLRKQGRA